MLKVDKNLVQKLPKYAQNWNWIQLEKSYIGGNYVDAICEALPDDPNRDEEPQVSFTCDNWTEFLWYVRAYHNSYRRMS